ncbi:MAG: hypothetical protein O9301_15105 [Leptospira sp.]|nr:hypothetical protein [Leptospira sp.]
MQLNETFVSHAHHYDFARRAQAENPFTHQNQVVELQKAALQTQIRAQSVPETKQNNSGSTARAKDEKEPSVLSYSRSGLIYNKRNQEEGSVFDSKV